MTLLIAEAGVNHNGSLDMALRLIDAAAEAGADLVKFQTFRAQNLASRQAPKAAYQMCHTDAAESQFDMLRKLELAEEAHDRLMEHCRACGIGFLSTPFDLDSLGLLVRKGVRQLKLGSGDLTNAPLLLAIGRSQLPLILSTGMATLGEVEATLGALAFGYLRREDPPSRDAFEDARSSPEGAAILANNVTLLHCTTEYPAPLADVNLRAMDTLVAAFGLPVGYSDHTEGIAVAIAAAARGAAVIEKHLTLDRKLPGPDHAASLEPMDWKALVQAVRDVEIALGDGRKIARPGERRNIAIARKSLVAARPIAIGESFSLDNLTCKRPGYGRSPFDYWSLLGRPASRAYGPDEEIE